MPVPIIDILTLAHSAIVELFTLDLNPIGVDSYIRFCNYAIGTTDVVWQGITYTAYPIQVTGFEYTGRGQLPTPQMTVSNVLSTITSLCLQYDDLVGAKLTRQRTLVKYLDGQSNADPNWAFDNDIYYIDRKSNENKVSVTFELASSLDLEGVRLPLRVITANICSFIYKSPQCGYVGNLPTCGKSLSDCKAHFGQYGVLNFGGFPAVDNNR